MSKKPFIGKNHGKGKIDLSDRVIAQMMRPEEIHLKEDGDGHDEPSFVIVMTNDRFDIVGEISLRMLNEGLADIGYKLIKDGTH